MTDMTFDDGNGNNAAIYCDVCTLDDNGEAVYLGRIYSRGTSYPITFDDRYIYTAEDRGSRPIPSTRPRQP